MCVVENQHKRAAVRVDGELARDRGDLAVDAVQRKACLPLGLLTLGGHRERERGVGGGAQRERYKEREREREREKR